MEGDRRTRLIIGAAMELALLALMVGLLALGNRTLGPGYEVRVDFDQVNNLKEGADVRYSARRIGRVLSIRQTARRGEPPLGARLRVDLWIEREFTQLVRKNSVLFINASGVIGDRYVEVGAPVKTPLAAAPEGTVFRGVDSPQLDRMIQYTYRNLRVMRALVKELEPELDALQRARISVMANLARSAPPKRLAALSRDLQALSTGAMALSRDVEQALERAPAAMAAVKGLGAKIQSKRQEALAVAARRLPSAARLDRLAGIISPAQRRRLDSAMARLGVVATRGQKLAAGLDALAGRVKKGKGSAGRLLFDRELVDEIKQTHRVLKESPWRVLARPPKNRAPRGKPPRRKKK